jgi:hypothetical protein
MAGFSFMFIMFVILGFYLLLNRRRMLAKILQHPVFIACYAFLLVGILLESLHTDSDYFEILRMAQMIAGAVSIACLCRDRRALHAGIHGYLLAGVCMSVLLFFTTFGVLSGATAIDFEQASRLRAATLEDNPLRANLNMMAFCAAQGTVVALALALFAKSIVMRVIFVGVTIVCAIASFLPMSRSGFVILVVSCASVMLAYGFRHVRTLLFGFLLVVAVLLWVPDVVFSRLSYSTEPVYGQLEGRARINTAVMDHLPEYVFTGIGAGNFWKQWGYESGFVTGYGSVVGAHNCFFQVTIYWGLPGLLALLLAVYQTIRYSLRRSGRDVLALSVTGIAVSLLLLLLVIHNIYTKEFSLGLGLLVASRYWIWPKGTVSTDVSASPVS